MFAVELLLPEGWASGGAVQVSGTKLTGVGVVLFPDGSDSPELVSLSNGGVTLVLIGLRCSLSQVVVLLFCLTHLLELVLVGQFS